MDFQLEITDQHGTRVEPYATSEAAKRAAGVLLETGAQRVTFSICGSPMWTRFARKEG